MKPKINLDQNELQFRGSHIIFGVKHVKLNIIPYGENTKISIFEAVKIKFN